MVTVELDVSRSINELNSRVGFIEGQIQSSLTNINKKLEESARTRSELAEKVDDIGRRLQTIEDEIESGRKVEEQTRLRRGLRIGALGVCFTALPVFGALVSQAHF